MSKIPKLLEEFRRGPELIAAALAGAKADELDFIPEPGKWSVRQILCHLADAEIVAAARFRRLLAEDGPTLRAYDQDVWARNLDYANRKVSEAMETFRHIRAWTYDLLSSQPEAAFTRTGVLDGRGKVSVEDLLAIYARHAEKHAEQIRKVRQAYRDSKSR